MESILESDLVSLTDSLGTGAGRGEAEGRDYVSLAKKKHFWFFGRKPDRDTKWRNKGSGL